MRSRQSPTDERDDAVSTNSGIRVLGWPAFQNRQNPYNALLYNALIDLGVEVEEFSTARLLTGGASILHVHWKPTSRIRGKNAARVAMRAAGFLLLLKAARMRGVRVVWTAHNVESHDSTAHPRLERSYWRILPGLLDAVISLSPSAVPLLHARYPALRNVPTFVVPHGHYRDAYPRNTTREAARTRFRIDHTARVFAFVGQVRPYKNVIALLRAFREYTDPDLVLLIGGMLKLGYQRAEFDALVAADPRVRVIPDFIGDDELQYIFAAADLAVLPFTSILNSGSAILALSFDRPVLVPRMGSLVDLADQVSPDWVINYDGPITADVLRDGMRAAQLLTNQSAPLDALRWKNIAEQTRNTYEAVLRSDRSS